VDQNCKLCGEIENTEHMIFNCLEYSGLIWEIFFKASNKMIGKSDPHRSLVFGMYNVMDAVPLKFSDSRESRALDKLICEIKREIIYRKYLRSQNPRLNNVIYTPQRVPKSTHRYSLQ
jgi:hypothetical protein